MKKTKKCKMCGKMFEYKLKTAKYCSHNCKEMFRVRNAKHDAVCSICGSSFYSRNGAKKFCSHPCSTKYASSQKLYKTLVCVDCGKSFLFQGRTRRLRCIPCRKKHRSKQSLMYQAAKYPNKKVGVGSGGAQWGVSNHQWNEYATYHGNKGYTHGYRAICFRLWDRECAACGRTDFEATFLDVHHIDGDRANRDESNVIPLCRQCHSKVHHQDVEYSCAEEYKKALTFVYPGWLDKLNRLLDSRSKIAELSGNPETGIRTEGLSETGQGQSIEGEKI